jgi:hypothetical protein
MSGTEWFDDPVEDGNTEAAAENPSKRGRGRPKATPPEWDAIASAAYSRLHPRTHRKRFHAFRAIEALGKTAAQDFPYLLGKRERWDILTELGLLDDNEQIREAAVEICEQKLNTKDAVVIIRRWRNGKRAPCDTKVLANEIAKAIRTYKVRHPDTSSEQVCSALWTVEQQFAEHEECPCEGDDLCEGEYGDEEHRRESPST